jgi:hypothetical protein
MNSTNIRIYADIQAIGTLERAVGAKIPIKLVVILAEAGRVAGVVGRLGAGAHAATHRRLLSTSFDNESSIAWNNIGAVAYCCLNYRSIEKKIRPFCENKHGGWIGLWHEQTKGNVAKKMKEGSEDKKGRK